MRHRQIEDSHQPTGDDSAKMRGMTGSVTPTGEVGEPRPRKRIGCLVSVVIFVGLAALAIVRNLDGDSSDSSDSPAAAPAATAPSGGATPTSVALRARQARYISIDETEIDPLTSLVALFASELRITSNAFNGLTSALGLPDELTSKPGGGGRVGRWDLPGSALLVIVEGESISLFCGTENLISAHVGDGVILCRSTLEEANSQASDGIDVFAFVPNTTSGGSGDWIACDSGVASESAQLQFGVNATADDPGSSAGDAAPTDIINGLKLSVCPG